MPLYDETETAFERRGSILIVRIFGSIEFFCVESLRKDIEFALNSERTETIVVSFADVALVDSSGLGLFLELQKRMTGSCELRLCDMSPNVQGNIRLLTDFFALRHRPFARGDIGFSGGRAMKADDKAIDLEARYFLTKSGERYCARAESP